MKAVLLAAGLGTRLKPITDSIPKCLVPINGVPLLDIWLDVLTKNNLISNIYVNLHYFSDKVDAHLQQRWSHVPHLKTWYEPTLLGTAGTLAHRCSEINDDDVMVIHADNLSKFDMNDFINSFTRRPPSSVMTMMLFKTDTPKTCGVVELDEQQQVITMHEKVSNPPSNLANAAVYILQKGLVATLKERQMSDFSLDVIPHFYGRINTWTNHVYHRDIGTPESLALAQENSFFCGE